jgi:uncharacterized Zn finger protein
VSDRDDKLIEFVNKTTPKIAQPKCPKCGHVPLEFLCNVVRTQAGHLVSVIWCSHCGHTLNTQFVGMDQPQAPTIIRPV